MAVSAKDSHMKILFYRYNSICEPDVIQAFKELGHSVCEIREEMTNKAVTPSECVRLVSNALEKTNSDIVFSINFYPAISEVCNIYHLPYVCWIVDSPVMELYTKSITNPWNRVFLFDNTLYQEFAPLNPDCIYYLPLATNVKAKQQVIKQAKKSGYVMPDVSTPDFIKKLCQYKSDIAFIGSLYTEKNPYDSLRNTSDFFNGYMDGLIEAQLKVYGYYFVQEALTENIIEEFKQCMPDFYTQPQGSYITDRATIAQYYIGNKIAAVERQRMLSLLSEKYDVDLYTGSDTSSLPHIHNRGFAKTLTEMPIIFHEAKINLNMTAKPIRTGIPQRIWDVFGSEEFLISNYQSEIPEYFVPGKDIVLYDSPETLMEQTDYYLRHENERKEIAHNAFEKTLEYHTYEKRVELMLESL